MSVFQRGDILLPREADLTKWAVIACDQFTSDPDYWQRVRETVGSSPSTLHMVLPEAELELDGAPRPEKIHAVMEAALRDGVFREYPDSYIYVRRTLQNGDIRQGLVGMVDLEEYDYRDGSASPIRATEKTVLERVPPRMEIRRGACVEFPHVIMLCDDDGRMLLDPIGEEMEALPKLYDFDLMEEGGHIAGWLVTGKTAEEFDRRMDAYCARALEKYRAYSGSQVLLAVGDGNHSLAAAKGCYEELKKKHPNQDLSRHPARYALVELENIHDESQVFEPVHRILTGVDVPALLDALERHCAPGGYPVTWMAGKEQGTLYLNPAEGALAVAVLQPVLDEWLFRNPGKIDYIHGDAELAALASRENALGLLLPPMEKGALFRGVTAGGVLPRKTFSMGHAREKRYYLEGRKIQ